MSGKEQEYNLSTEFNDIGELYRCDVDNLKEIPKKEGKNPHFII